jgi:8-oxo-dGTP pyrophosphatase MutT (NUDIX family)
MLAEAIVDRVTARLARELAPPRTALLPFIVDGVDAGYVDERRARRLQRFADVFVLDATCLRFIDALATPTDRTQALHRIALTLSGEGALTGWRNERYAASAPSATAPLFEIERAAARYFGIATHAAHVNATTTEHDGTERMWIARRSPDKSIDPGMLDNLVGGGVAAHVSVAETLVKEAREEAGIPRSLASEAKAAGVVGIFREQSDGVQRETVHVYDLHLPPTFAPRNKDGEVTDYRLASIERVAQWIGEPAGEDAVTADASLVIVDWLIRQGYVTPAHRGYATLERLRRCAARDRRQ